jgi:four helix bundle protein
MTNGPIRSFRDLEVYRNTHALMLEVAKHLLPILPDNERFDLRDQLSRSSKAVPRLIAEGYAKRHQKLGFQKYLDDAMAECNESAASLEQCRDLYPQSVNQEICNELIRQYDVSGRQLYKLAEAWRNFGKTPSTIP